jgi:CheY-like chemotaxis protein
MANVLIAALDGNLGYLLRKELEDEGHRVDHVLPGVELTAYLADHPAYDVVLIDLQTSGLTDLNALSTIRKACPHIHIIVFSDRVAPQERAALHTSGADRSFMKHQLNDLKEHLRQNITMPVHDGSRPSARRGAGQD